MAPVAEKAKADLTSVLGDLLGMDGARVHASSKVDKDEVSVTFRLPRNDKWTKADHERAMKVVALAMSEVL